MARYGKSAGQKVKRAMHERKKGTLKSGRSGKTVKSRSRLSPSACPKRVVPAARYRQKDREKRNSY